MPRYYFHVRRGRVTILDREGVELIDDMEAAIEVTRLARQNQGKRSSNTYWGQRRCHCGRR